MEILERDEIILMYSLTKAEEKNVIMEILKRDEIILMYSLTKAAGLS